MQEKLYVVPLTRPVTLTPEYLVSSEWRHKNIGDFLFANNQVIGILEKFFEDNPGETTEETTKKALYVSIKHMIPDLIAILVNK